jgi:sec-independent protein translocase protein TatA
MGSMSLVHWIIVLAVVMLLFGAGKIPRLMGDFAKGIKAFKAGMKDDDTAAEAAPETKPQVTSTTNAAPAGAHAGAADLRHGERG